MIGSQLFVLVWVLIQRQHSAGDGISSGVVAAHNQQNQVAQKLHRRHVLSIFAMSQHGQQVNLRRLVAALLAQVGEVLQTLHQRGPPIGFRCWPAG